MKLEFKQIKQKEIWDNFVQSLGRYSFVQSWDYLNVEETLYDELLRIGVFDGEELVGLLPVGVIRAKRGSYLKLRHGPIVNYELLISNYEKTEENLFSEIAEYLKNLAREKSVSFIRIQPITNNFQLLTDNKFIEAPTHNLDGEETLQLKLEILNSKSEILKKSQNPNESVTRNSSTNDLKAELQKNMRKNTRYYIRKAAKEGTVVVKDNSDFDSFYKLFIDTTVRQGYTPWPKKYYQEIFNQFESDNLSLYFAEVDGKRVGFGLFMDYGKYRFYKEGGMLTEYSKSYPSYAVQWKAISDAVDKGLEIYDFWGGVSPKDHNGEIIKGYPWAGINLFKAGFGGEELKMVHPHDLAVNWKYWITHWFEKIEKMRRGY